jgi:uncharacterized phage protein (TIGR02220 family)
MNGAPALPRHRRISTRLWSDSRFRALSPIRPSGQALWLYLLTGPHTGVVPGLFVAGPAALAEALGWPLTKTQRCLEEITVSGMAVMDPRSRLVCIPNAAKHNPPASPNVVRAWRKAFDELPECPLRDRAGRHLAMALEGFGKGFVEAFGKGFAKAPADPSPIQDQDQDQNQDQNKDFSPKPPHGGLVVPTARSRSRGAKTDDARTAEGTAALTLLNELTGSAFKATAANLKHARARLADGYTLQDLHAVVRGQVMAWRRTEWAKYLRPQTLFAEKFAGYLEATRQAGNGAGDPHRINAQWDGVESGEARL